MGRTRLPKIKTNPIEVKKLLHDRLNLERQINNLY